MGNSFGFGFSSSTTSRPWYPQPSQLLLPSPALQLLPPMLFCSSLWPTHTTRPVWERWLAQRAGQPLCAALLCSLQAASQGWSNFCLISGFQKTWRNSVSLQPPPFCQACLKPDGFKLRRGEESGLLDKKHLLISVTYQCEHPCNLYLYFSGFMDCYPELLQATMVSPCEIQSPFIVQKN